MLKAKIGTQNRNFLDPLTYLNEQRIQSGMIGFIYNQTLELASINHAKYESFNKDQGHSEDRYKKFFTGEDPQKRALYVGYMSRNVSENISYNKNFISSIDSLFTAIYHRFGFLSFDKNEIGFSLQKDGNYTSTVFVMGNSYLNDICKYKKDTSPRRYYDGVCKDKSIKIQERVFNQAIRFANNDIILYPYKNAQNIATFFSGEIPDPMPNCKITANPISVQFEPSNSKIVLKSFKLYENLHEVIDTHIITHQNDINGKFGKNEFALFGLSPYKFDTTYNAVFEYEKDQKPYKISWNFKTKKPENDYFIIKEDENIAIKSDKKYDIFFMPKDCNDIVKRYKTSRPMYLKFHVKQKGVNYLTIEAKGLKNDKISFTTDNGKKINIYLQTSSISIKKSNQNYFIIGFLLSILALFLLFWKRKANRQ